MPPTPIRSHNPQSLNIVPYFPPQVVLDFHGREIVGNGLNGSVGYGANFGVWEDGVLCENLGRMYIANAVERFEGFL